MISLLNRQVRKWLLVLALSARRAAEAAVSRLSVAEEGNDRRPGKETGSNTGKTARSEGPPDHWVRLVQRHAPELLQPGPPYLGSSSETRKFGEYVDPGAPGKADYQDLKNGDEVSADFAALSDSPFSSKSLSENSVTPRESGRKRPLKSFSGNSEATVKTQGNLTAGKTCFPSSINPSGFADKHRSRESIGGRRTTDRFMSATPETNSGSMPKRTSAEERMKSKTPDPFKSFTSSTADNGEHPRKNKSDEKTMLRDSREDLQIAMSAKQLKREPEPGAEHPVLHIEFDTAPSSFRKAKRQTEYETKSVASGSLKSEKIPKVGVYANATGPIIKSEDASGHLDPVRMNQGASRGQSIENKETIDEERSQRRRFVWPVLPEEHGSGDFSVAGSAGTWPSLPEEKSVGGKSVWQQKAQSAFDDELREAERIRRLDEEQKGIKWNASYF